MLLSLVGLLQGCAAVFGVMAVVEIAGGVAVAASPDLEPLPKAETNRASLAYPIAAVFATLQQSVGQNGRTMVEAIDESHSLRVSYPSSLVSNEWGGVITISCIAEGQGTTVVFLGSGRDASQRLQKIGNEILLDLRNELAGSLRRIDRRLPAPSGARRPPIARGILCGEPDADPNPRHA